MKQKTQKKIRLKFIIPAVVLLLAGYVAVRLVWLKPFTINLLYERALLKYALTDPQTMTSVGLLDKLGLDYYNKQLSDPSFKALNKTMDMVSHELDVLRSFDRSSQTPRQLLSTDILDWYLVNTLDSRQFMYNGFPVNQFLGAQKALPKFMVNSHIILSEGDAKDYIQRLNQFPSYFDGLIESLKTREANGYLPPLFIVSGVLRDIEGFVEPPAERNSLYTAFETKVTSLKLSANKADKLLADAEKAIGDSVYPSYQKLYAYFQELLAKAQDYVGVWSQPNGDAYYAYCVKNSTSLDIPVEELYTMIDEDVKRIRNELKSLQEKGLANEPVKPIQSLENCQKAVDEMYDNLPELFNHIPDSKVVVQFAITNTTADAGIVQYMGSDLNNSVSSTINIPATFLSNDTYSAKWVLYHEGYPGHHLQLSIARELKNLPTFRRMIPFDGFVEGWGTYAQELPYQYGLATDPNWQEGILKTRLLHMGRALMDIGINYKRWSREEAIQFALENNICDRQSANFLVDYCTAVPGSELSYAVGCLKIEGLKEYAQGQLGDRFDIREFHDEVLKNGSVPLDILDQVIKAYVQGKLSSGK